jgi:acetolactate synthase-1/2/3 large subunit
MNEGARELVVFIHAVGGDSSSWEPQREAFGGEYHVLAVDLVRPAAEVTIEGFADDVARAIADAGHVQAHLVGLSLGGVVALEVFRRHRARVRSIAMASSWAFMPDGAQRWAWVSGELEGRTVAEFSRKTLPALFAPTTDPAIVAHGLDVEGRKDHAMYLACWREMLHADLRPVLPTLDVPLLLIGGALDPVTPARPLSTAIHDVLHASRLVELPAASHFSNLDCPQAFDAVLRSFLRSARARGHDDLPPAHAVEAVTLPAGSTAEQLLRLLDLRGVELLAANSGTDFTPIIDALALLADAPAFGLRVVAAPHENTAIAMAHGHALLSRRPQAVMGHVGVGTANMGLGIMNARRAHVPMLVLSGRTPWYEEGVAGVRSNFVQWGQDTFDQGGYFREFSKWDYELKGPHALDTVVDRALAIAASEPAGPVYLTLPREPLCQAAPERAVAAVPRQRPVGGGVPDAAQIEAAIGWIRGARVPLVITADLGRHAGGPEALARFAVAAGAGVVEHGKRNFFNLPTRHPHHLGFEPMPHVAEADLVIAIECPVPWIPVKARLARAPRVIQIGTDPLHTDLPMRGFPCDLGLMGDPTQILRVLGEALAASGGASEPSAALGRRHDEVFGAARERARADGSRPTITKRFLSYVLGNVVDDDVVIFNEYDLDPTLVERRHADSWFENSIASGLGWALGAALGAKIAAPERTMVATVGDGSYLFNTPLSAHYVATAERLPILVVVFDDQGWSTIEKSVRAAHPAGHSVRTGRFALCGFAAPLDLAKVAEACGGIGIREDRPAALEDTLRHALALVRGGDRHVLVDVRCEPDGSDP